MKEFSVENNFAKITFREDKILHIHYTTEELNLEKSKEVLKFTRENCPWELSPLLLSGGDFVDQDNESRNYNGSDEVIKYCSAIALISETLPKKILANFFIFLFKEKVPMRFFVNKQDAIKWLHQFPTIEKKEFSFKNTENLI